MIAPRTQLGFSLIEMIVSLGLFSVVITISVGALLSLIASNSLLRDQQNIMTSLAFTLDSMTREIRTGNYYYCDNSNFANQDGFDNITASPPTFANQDCVNGDAGISFIEGGESITNAQNTRIAYYLGTGNDAGKIMRRIDDQSPQSLVSSGVYVTNFVVTVTGSRPLSGTGGGTQNQPVVTLFIEARESATSGGQPYYVQTTVTQRSLDL